MYKYVHTAPVPIYVSVNTLRAVRPYCAMSDDELRRRLKAHGYDFGPITDSTRKFYVSKLRALDGDEVKATSHVGPGGGADGASPKSACPSPGPRPPHAEPCPAQGVVARLAISLDNPHHVSADTAFLFPDGDVLLASRAILACQSPGMVQILYNEEMPFPLVVLGVSAAPLQCYGRPSELVLDLKEKVSMVTSLPVTEQRLFLGDGDVELANQNTLASYGLRAGTTVHLTMATGNHSLPPPCHTLAYISPALSIAHLTLNYGLMLLLGISCPTLPPHPPHIPLSPHTAHIVHVYDVPSAGLRAFLHYLYSGVLEIPDASSSAALLVLVCCYVLAVCLKHPLLSTDCLNALPPLLTVETTLSLVKFAESINSPPLRDMCIQALEARQHA